MEKKTVSMQTMSRLPAYLHYLRSVREEKTTISATSLAAVFGLNDVQVRKDLGAVSGSGRPKTGYVINELISQIESRLGYNSITKTVLIGAGNLGSALMSYEGFRDYGLTISAAFDIDDDVCGKCIHGINVYKSDKIEEFCKENEIILAIICVPASAAQSVCDRLVGCGIRAIWNFAPTILRVPETVKVAHENLASSLALLSEHLQ